MSLHIKIVTQDGVLFDEPEVDQVNLPGSEGEMGILPNHAALLSTLNYGEVVVRKAGAEESFIVYGGIAEVRPDSVTILADTAESSYAVDQEKATEARQRAEQLMHEGIPQEKTNTVLQDLRRATLQEKILNKVRIRNATRIRVLEDDENK
jgi:F-type H+-transporting ATPase subunit epsilon